MNRLIAALIASALAWACSGNESETAGATSETTNGIAFRVVDAEHTPLAMARVSLYSVADMVKLDSSVTDSDGVAHMVSPKEDCYLEGIAGKDSSLMSFAPFDTAVAEVSLSPAATVILNYSTLDSSWRGLDLFLLNTPYSAKCVDGDDLGRCVFAHVPAGEFEVVKEKSVGESSSMFFVSAAPGDTSVVENSQLDTMARDSVVRDTSMFVFENFDDGDGLNNLAKIFPNYGWYVVPSNGADFICPDTSSMFMSSLNADGAYSGLSFMAKFDLHDTGYVLIGTHLGGDSAHFDLQKLTAVRMKVKGDGDFAVALEHYKEIPENRYNKAFWKSTASGEWREVVFHPGEEFIDVANDQVSFEGIRSEIGIFSIFMTSGTYFQVDEIIFEGVNEEDLKK